MESLVASTVIEAVGVACNDRQLKAIERKKDNLKKALIYVM